MRRSCEANWQDAIAKEPHFIISETPHYVGRAVAHLASVGEVLAILITAYILAKGYKTWGEVLPRY